MEQIVTPLIIKMCFNWPYCYTAIWYFLLKVLDMFIYNIYNKSNLILKQEYLIDGTLLIEYMYTQYIK